MNYLSNPSCQWRYYLADLSWPQRGAVLLFVVAMVLAGLALDQALGAEQTRLYGPNGQSLGTAVPQGEGSVRYYDSRGNSLGTSTTTGNTTRFYGPSGQSLGSSTGPARPSVGGRR
jgi:hypothetical protein